MRSNEEKIKKDAIIKTYFDSNLVFQEHKARYEFANRIVEGNLILDLGCGIGHGTKMLSINKNRVVGIEIDINKLYTAYKHFNADNIHYLVADARFLPFKNNIFDFVISLEVIEHIAEHNQYLAGINRVLKSNGKSIISTPNKEIIRSEGTISNPIHVKELTFKEFKNSLTKYFSKVELYGQTRRRGVKGISGILYHIVRKVDILKLRVLFSRNLKDRILKKISKATGAKDPHVVSTKDVSILKVGTRRARNLIGVCDK